MKGKVYIVDKSEKRLSELKKKFGNQIITVNNQNQI